MREFEYVINDELGIHARPAGEIVKLVKSLGAVVTIAKGDKAVDASRLMSLMGLGVRCKDKVRVRIEGGNEDVAYDSMKEYFEANL